MDKNAARTIVKETFQNSFQKDRFYRFSKELLNRFEDASFVYRGNYIPDAYEPYVQTLERLGKYQDPDGKKIDLLVATLKKGSSLEHARTMQRNFIAWYLNGSRGGELKDAALVAFVAPDTEDWRFSLVKMEYRIVETLVGKVKAKEEFTPARRYSFLVGKNEATHTAQSRLVPLLEDDVHSPTLHALEDTFNIETVTKEFFEKYRELYLRVKETLDDLLMKDASVREDFRTKTVNTVDFAKKLLGQIVFLYFLQRKGWFGVKRHQDWGSGSKHFLRELFEKRHSDYSNFFNDILEPLFYEALRVERPDDYYSRFDCRIPFLNGGLFDPLNNYDWIDTDIHLPNDLFSNTSKTDEGDTGTGILDIFDRYNFTVKEDEPLEKEVAVDPEMLGKVFENLLEVKDRKSKGTYYTPREIVHYMCQESLVNYLAAELAGVVSTKDIETLLKYGETVVEHDTRVQNRGRETKTYSYKLPSAVRDNAKAIDDKLAEILICDPAVGSGAFPVGMMSEVIRTRSTLTPYLTDRSERTLYDFKRHAVQNSLYGVDIDPGAIEIAKLRLWLSLVVDEEDIRQIKPLPNLDYKLVHGNSLVGVEHNLFNRTLFAQLEELKPLFFDETNAPKKQAYKKRIDELIRQLTDNNQHFDFAIYFSEVFHGNSGFDVVIANPPYGARFSASERESFLRQYRHQDYQLDSYLLFLERGFDLLHTAGVLAFIIPNPWLTNLKLRKIRRFLFGQQTVRQIVHYARKVFDATVDTEVVIVSKEAPQDNRVWVRVVAGADSSVDRFVEQRKWAALDGEPVNIFTDSHQEAVIEKLRTGTVLLKDVCDVTVGMKPYQVGKGIPKQTRSVVEGRPFDSTSRKDKTYRPLLRGRDIDRYVNKWDGRRWIKYGAHLAEPRPSAKFDAPLKIVIRQTGDSLVATLDNSQFVCMNNMHTIVQRDKTYDLRFILGLLNSRLLNYYFQWLNPEKGEALAEVKKEHVENLVIKKPSEKQSDTVIRIVDRILAAKEREPAADTTKLEREIDNVVYTLYELTPDQIEVIEGTYQPRNREASVM